MKVIKLLINTNIYIALAAVMLTIGTQVQLGLKPSFEFYLPLVFFLTLIDYNLYRIIKVIFSKSSITREKHNWSFKNIKSLYITLAFAIVGFIVSLFYTEAKVLVWILPIGIVAFAFSLPPKIGRKEMPNLKKVPHLKIFIFSITWAIMTVLLPVSQMNYHTTFIHVFLMLLERFLFIFSLTVTFDIRDMLEDYKSGIRSIPIIYGKQKSKLFADWMLVAAMVIGVLHYLQRLDYSIAIALVISLMVTLLCMNFKRIQNSSVYYHGILDGTILLQGILLTISYYLPF